MGAVTFSHFVKRHSLHHPLRSQCWVSEPLWELTQQSGWCSPLNKASQQNRRVISLTSGQLGWATVSLERISACPLQWGRMFFHGEGTGDLERKYLWYTPDSERKIQRITKNGVGLPCNLEAQIQEWRKESSIDKQENCCHQPLSRGQDCGSANWVHGICC